jgi:hypothetical protein
MVGRGNDRRNCLRLPRFATLSAAIAGRGKQYTDALTGAESLSPFVSVVPGRVRKSLVTSPKAIRRRGGDPD